MTVNIGRHLLVIKLSPTWGMSRLRQGLVCCMLMHSCRRTPSDLFRMKCWLQLQTKGSTLSVNLKPSERREANATFFIASRLMTHKVQHVYDSGPMWRCAELMCPEPFCARHKDCWLAFKSSALKAQVSTTCDPESLMTCEAHDIYCEDNQSRQA